MRTTVPLLIPAGGVAASLKDAVIVYAAPGPGTTSVFLPDDADHLPLVLAGPQVRHAAESGVTLWFATSRPLRLRGRVLAPPNGSLDADVTTWAVLGDGAAEPIRLGPHLYVTTLRIRPNAGPFPLGVILGYDVEATAPPNSEFDGDGLFAASDLTYAPARLPTFTLGRPPEERALNVMHGSCRKLHGDGKDAMIEVDTYMQSVAGDASARPSAFLLTGDQIYADDVDRNILSGIVDIAERLVGFQERMPDGRLLRDAKGMREPPLKAAGFTFDAGLGGNHLMGFGEFAAMYALAWSPALWGMSPYNEKLQPSNEKIASAAATQRVLANVPTYMILDDHEVTDDWPMSKPMWDAVEQHLVAKWVVANGWAACRAFQLVGNTAGGTIAGLRALQSYLSEGQKLPVFGPVTMPPFRDVMKEYARAIFRDRGFGFVTPTTPPIVFLDTRTQRELLPDAPPGLLNKEGLAQLKSTLASLPGEPTAPLLIVAPSPVLGCGELEAVQDAAQLAADRKYTVDPEAMSLNANTFYSFLSTLQQTQRGRVVFFSGDVHFAFMKSATFSQTQGSSGGDLQIVQLTSSALCNSPKGWRETALRGVNLTSGTRHGISTFTKVRNYSSSNAPPALMYEGVGDIVQTILHETVASIKYKYHDIGSGVTCTKNNFGIVTVSWNQTGATKVTQKIKQEGASGLDVTTEMK